MAANSWKRITACSAVCAILAAAGAWSAGIRVNRTSSFPRGIYRLSKRPWTRGDLVLVDVPTDRAIFKVAETRGYLFASLGTSGVVPLLKKVVAIEGDQVAVGAEVTVNGRELFNSGVRAKDSAGRPLAPAIGGAVPSGQVWVMSDKNPLSFDSRYFGPLPASLIRGRMTPLWTWR
jgi:conjugative transfer signal peptidase TraF